MFSEFKSNYNSLLAKVVFQNWLVNMNLKISKQLLVLCSFTFSLNPTPPLNEVSVFFYILFEYSVYAGQPCMLQCVGRYSLHTSLFEICIHFQSDFQHNEGILLGCNRQISHDQNSDTYCIDSVIFKSVT